MLDLIGALPGGEGLARVQARRTGDGAVSQEVAHAAWRVCVVCHPSVEALARTGRVDGEAVAMLCDSGALGRFVTDPLFLAAAEHCLLPGRDSEALVPSRSHGALAALADGQPLSDDALT